MSEDESPKKQLPWIKAPSGVAEIYANMIHVTWTLDDVRLRLGQVVDSPETPNPGAQFEGATQERAAISFSWRNTKLLRDQLTTIIDSFEKTNGKINIGQKLAPPPSS